MNSYVWKHFPGSEDWGLFPRGTKELEEDTAVVILSRQNRFFPWSVYVSGQEDKDALDGCESDSLKDIKEYILDNLDKIIGKEESLTEAPDDDGIMNDDELDAEEQRERDEMEARFKARRDKIAQERSERDARKAKEAELKAKADEVVKQIGKDWSFDHLFDVLVPSSGKSNSLAGELIRAANRIEYRWFNDGDRFFEDYGIETCGQPAYFLMNFEINDEMPLWDFMLNVAEDNADDKYYDAFLEELKNKVAEIVQDNPTLLVTDTKDMYDTISVRYVANFFYDYDMIPTYDYDCSIPSELQAHLDRGNIDERDLIWYVQDLIANMGDSTNDVSVDWGNVYINGLERSDYGEISDNLYRWLEDYAQELDDEYGDPNEESEPEEEPEEESEPQEETLEEEKLTENKVLDDMANEIEALLKDNKIPSPYIDINDDSVDVGASDEEHLNKIKDLLSANGYSHLEDISGGAPKYYGVRIEVDSGPTHGYATKDNYERSQAILDEMTKLRNEESEQADKLLKAWAVDKVIGDDEFTKKIGKLRKEIQDKEDALYKELTELHAKDKELRNK